MPDSPIAATPYEVLGVSASASTEELRKAYRRMLREAHPDTGGSDARFHAVQRAWERIGTPASRAIYDRGHSAPSSGSRPAGAGAASRENSWEERAPRTFRDSRPSARSYGHPGGWNRERYLTTIREWVGRGATLDDPYDPALVRSAPRELRHLLADALAEEASARALSGLGIAYTVWHDVQTDAGKLDHVVLGPAGLFAVQSEDWGAPVRVRKSELIGEAIDGERPFHSLAARAKSVERPARVRFTALAITVPDDATEESLTLLGRVKGIPSVLVQQSRLPDFMRTGLPGEAPIGGNELFDIRTRLQASIRFV
ncbi:J domain-containing protein [Parafrigoribacterium soli]|uniref:J domain-containing protein n=1 Tax=Parafrigoribacterium soli TaxID=3144663 RepID=UPI0032EEEB6D